MKPITMAPLRRRTALIGCGLLAFGVFSPVMSVPLGGTVPYLALGRDGSTPVGKLTLILAGAAFLATLFPSRIVLWIAGLGSLGLELFVFVLISRKMGAGSDVQLAWGWPVLAAGGIALIVAAGMKQKTEPDRVSG